MATPSANLDALPDTALSLILRHLDSRDIENLRGVCRALRAQMSPVGMVPVRRANQRELRPWHPGSPLRSNQRAVNTPGVLAVRWPRWSHPTARLTHADYATMTNVLFRTERELSDFLQEGPGLSYDKVAHVNIQLNLGADIERGLGAELARRLAAAEADDENLTLANPFLDFRALSRKCPSLRTLVIKVVDGTSLHSQRIRFAMTRATFPRLESLDVSMEGVIPQGPFPYCPQLRVLNFRAALVDGLVDFAELRRTSRVHLHKVTLGNIVPGEDHWRVLRHLPDSMDGPSDLSMLQGIHTLDLLRLNAPLRLPSLEGTRHLILHECNRLQEIHNVRDLDELVITKCAVVRVSDVSHCRSLSIHSCASLERIEDCSNLAELWIRRCNALTHVSRCDKIRRVAVSTCEDLEELDVTNTDSVRVHGCPLLAENNR